MQDSIVIQHPAAAAQQLFLLFHGVGATPQGLVPVGRKLAETFPNAWIVSIPSPDACDFGNGFQWFSVQGITEESRPERIAAAMPGFVATVHHWQQHTGLPVEATALIGFSQGGIMALESTQLDQPLAGRVASLSGRFAQLPGLAPAHTTVHMFHGKSDQVIPYGFTVCAAERLVRLGADVTADVLPFVGHEVTPEILELLVERLTGHLPKRHWEAAQIEADPAEPNAA